MACQKCRTQCHCVTAPPPIDGSCCYFDKDTFEYLCQTGLSECECLKRVYGYWNPGADCAAGRCDTTPPPCDLFCCHIDGEITLSISCDPTNSSPTCPPNFYPVGSFQDCVPTTIPPPTTDYPPVFGACCHGFGDSCAEISELFYGHPDSPTEQEEFCLDMHPDGAYYAGVECGEIDCATSTTTTTTVTTQGPELFGACCNISTGSCYNLVGTIEYMSSLCDDPDQTLYYNITCQQIQPCDTYTTTTSTTTTTGSPTSTTTTTTAAPGACNACCLGDLQDPDSVISIPGLTDQECASIGGVCSETTCDDLINPPEETTTTTTTTTATPVTSETTTTREPSSALCCACCDEGVDPYIPTGEVDSNGQPYYTCHSSCEVQIEGNARCANVLIRCDSGSPTTTTQEPFLIDQSPNN